MRFLTNYEYLIIVTFFGRKAIHFFIEIMEMEKGHKINFIFFLISIPHFSLKKVKSDHRQAKPSHFLALIIDP